MKVVSTKAELRAALATSHKPAFVPTMGALHQGHISLMHFARSRGDAVVVSIFVNPTQFGAGEDFAEYPRTMEADLEKCAAAGVDVVFTPSVTTMYPHGVGDISIDPGPLGAILEGAQRPTHFRGVLTVVAKLLGLVQPAVAVFGEKDYQQLVLIRRMVKELSINTDIVGAPIIREADGLAMSSRNVYLSPADREKSLVIPKALQAGARAAAQGEAAVLAAAQEVFDQSGITPDYLVVTDSELGESKPGADARLLVAAKVGTPRLLDNIHLRLGN